MCSLLIIRQFALMTENSTNIQTYASIKEKTTRINHINSYISIQARKAFALRAQRSSNAETPDSSAQYKFGSIDYSRCWRVLDNSLTVTNLSGENGQQFIILLKLK